ncbi:uncharacterized protein LOC142098005 [Mixophyes fleayi]|uniref:uncharacterized protein LOC142098005 n=1 Tax=Mixophyes fleayi TaxID=3061075 RepID=UPI003F4DF9F3
MCKKMTVTRFLLLFCLQPGAALELIVPPTQKAMMGADVQIPCSFKVNNSPVNHKDLKIVWLFQGKEILSVEDKEVITTDPRVSYIDRAIDGIADLTISNITLSDGGMYTCSVLYSSDRKEKEIRLDIQGPPQITITDKTVIINKESVLHSSITGFYPEDIDIKWLRDGELLDRITVDTFLRHQDGTFSVNSSVMITPTEEDRERNFSCTVQHQSLNGPLQEDFQLVYGAAPSVSITSPIFKVNVEEMLVCHVSGFYPESIAVNWLLNGTLVENTKTRNITSSSVESIYKFLPTEQNWGVEISCVVEHDTLIHPHVKRLLVVGKDLKPRYKVHVVIVAIVLVCALGIIIIVVLIHRYRKSRLPKARHIICSTDGRLSLNVDHFYPKDISVCWTVIQPPSSTKHKTLESTVIMEENQDGTFNVTSSCETLRDKVNVNEPYIVRAAVTHQKLKHPIHKDWDSEKSDIKYFLSRPEMDEIQTPHLLLDKQTQLQCTVSRYYPDDLTVTWYKKGRGNKELIPMSDNETKKLPIHQSQQQRDKTFIYTACLVITPSLEDQGSEFICRVEHPSLEQPIERSTGPVLVKYFLSRPEMDEIQTPDLLLDKQTQLQCTVSRYYPDDLTVTWYKKGRGNKELIPMSDNETKKLPIRRSQQQRDKTFTYTACLVITPSLGDQGSEFICRVEHPSLEQPIERSTGPVQVKNFHSEPEMGEIQTPDLLLDKQTQLQCTVSRYYPDDLTVTWYRKGRGNKELIPMSDNETKKLPIHRSQQQRDKTFTYTACLVITPSLEDQGSEFICRVEHPSLEQPIERSTGPVQVKREVLCSLSLKRFYPHSITVTWTSGEQHNTITSENKITQSESGKTFDVISQCRLPQDFQDRVYVTWEHESLPQPHRTMLTGRDFPWCPQIGEIDTSKLFLNATECKLQCNISGYFPDAVSVSWYKMETGDQIYNPLSDCATYKMSVTKSQRQSDNTYCCTASLVITPSLRDQGSEIICRVEHPSLEEPIERRSGPLQLEEQSISSEYEGNTEGNTHL